MYPVCWRYRKRESQRGRLSLSPKRAAPPNRGRLIKLVNSTHISKSCKPPEAPLRGAITETQRRARSREKTTQQSSHQRWKHFQRKLPQSMETMADHLSRHRLSSETTQRSLMSSGRCNTFELVRMVSFLRFDLSMQFTCLFSSSFSPAVNQVKEKVFTSNMFEELNLHPHLVRRTNTKDSQLKCSSCLYSYAFLSSTIWQVATLHKVLNVTSMTRYCKFILHFVLFIRFVSFCYSYCHLFQCPETDHTSADVW